MPAWRGDGPPARLRREPARRRQLRHLDDRPDGRRAAAGRRRARPSRSRPPFSARRQDHVPDARAGRAVPGEDERLGHAAGRAARAAARLRPARTVPAHGRRHEARLRLGDRQHRRRAGLGPRQPAGRGRPDARAAARPDVGRLGAHVRRRGPPPLHALADAHALAPARLPALRAPHARRRARRARPEERLLPRRPLRPRRRRVAAFTGAHFFGNCAAVEPARALRRAGHVDRLHRPLPRPLPRPEPRAPRRARRGSTCSSTARTRRCSSRRSTTRTTPRRSASGSAGVAASRASRPSRSLRGLSRLLGRARPEARRDRAGGRARRARRPSRSSRNACIPSARAPSMSSS